MGYRETPSDIKYKTWWDALKEKVRKMAEELPEKTKTFLSKTYKKPWFNALVGALVVVLIVAAILAVLFGLGYLTMVKQWHFMGHRFVYFEEGQKHSFWALSASQYGGCALLGLFKVVQLFIAFILLCGAYVGSMDVGSRVLNNDFEEVIGKKPNDYVRKK